MAGASPASRKLVRVGLAAVLVVAGLAVMQGSAPAATSCGVSAGVNVCLTVDNGALSGDETVTATITGSASTIKQMEFSWGPTSSTSQILLYDVERPWTFTWPTDRYLDGTQWLVVRVRTWSGTAGAPVGRQVTLNNGNATEVPPSPTDWAAGFQPRNGTGDPVVAGVGDGANGMVRSAQLASSIESSDAEAFFYLGDVYERGTAAEWLSHYGRSSLDGGAGTLWGRMARYTVPILGNHEAFNPDAFRHYWRGRPDYSTFVYGGVRYLALSSECAASGGCGPGSPQYEFAEDVLAANTHACVVGVWHRPVISTIEDRPAMNPLFALLNENGGDALLTAHTHHMAAYEPMDSQLRTGQPGSHMVQLISAAGGHNMISQAETDARVDWQVNKVTGAAYLTAVGGRDGPASQLDWAFRKTDGNVAISADGPGTGSIDCGQGSTPDTEPPSTPAKPTATSTAAETVDVSWPASTDDRATELTYRVYRDGGATPVGSVSSASTGTISYRDTGLTSGDEHTYRVSASDGTNESPPGPPSDPVTVAAGSPSLLADGFSGGFGAWTRTSALSLDSTRAPPGGATPSARAQASSAKPHAYKQFTASAPSVCASEQVNVSSASTNLVLARLRTAADGPVARVYMTSSDRRLWLRSDVSGQQVRTSYALPLNSWHEIEVCTTIGTSGSVTLAVDGTQIGSPWTANLGTAPVGALYVGDTSAVTATFNLDDVAVTAN